MIYEFVLGNRIIRLFSGYGSPALITMFPSGLECNGEPMADMFNILSTCRQIHSEAEFLPFSLNTFQIYLDDVQPFVEGACIPVSHLHAIEELEVLSNGYILLGMGNNDIAEFRYKLLRARQLPGLKQFTLRCSTDIEELQPGFLEESNIIGEEPRIIEEMIADMINPANCLVRIEVDVVVELTYVPDSDDEYGDGEW